MCYVFSFFSGIQIEKWYNNMRSSYGRIKKEFQKTDNTPPVLKYRAAVIWKHLAFLKPHMRNKTPGVIMSRVSVCIRWRLYVDIRRGYT